MATVQWINDKRENGLVASKPVKEDDVIFTERPLIATQYYFNSRHFPACSHCLKCLEQPGEMLRRLAQTKDDMPLLDSLPCPERVKCDMGCDHIYCSAECKSEALEQYHGRLCSRVCPKVDDLKDMWTSIHFPPEQASILLMARMIALMLSRMDAGVPAQEALAMFSQFKQKHDGDVMHRFFAEDKQEQIEAMRGCMRSIFAGDLRVDSVFEDAAVFQDLFAVMAVNGQGVGTSTIESRARDLMLDDEREQEADELLDFLDSVYPIVDEVSGEFTHVEGSALYSMHSKINHSCRPNAEIQFRGNSSELSVVALRDIDEGEEITISYIDMDDSEENGCHDEHCDDIACGSSSSAAPSVQKCSDASCDDDHVHLEPTRREILKAFYLFDCDCERCVDEYDTVEVAGH